MYVIILDLRVRIIDFFLIADCRIAGLQTDDVVCNRKKSAISHQKIDNQI
jgi:hypothetical protein